MQHEVTIWLRRPEPGVVEAWVDDPVHASARTQGDSAVYHATRMVAADVLDHLAQAHRAADVEGPEGVTFTVREGGAT